MDAKIEKLLIPPDICPRCGKTFSCSKGGKCWCFEVHLSHQALSFIQQQYSTCLCPDCLQEVKKSFES